MFILVTDIFYRKAFDVISILKKIKNKEDRLLLGCPNGSYSVAKLCYGRCIIEDLRTDTREVFYSDLKNISEKFDNEEIIYLPVEERTTEFFIEFIGMFGSLNFKFLLPGEKMYKTFQNKLFLNKYCLEKGISAPKIYEIEELKEEILPVIMKPCNGSGSDGIRRIQTVNQIDTKLVGLLKSKPYVIQELIPNGKDVKGAFFLAKNGEIVSFYSHSRLRTFPEEGGVTVLSKTSMDYNILEIGKKLLKESSWSGLVMLEFLYDPKENKYKIIEANPRLWGSIMLSEYNNSNMLKNYILLCKNQTPVIENINTETYVRWLIPDIIYIFKNMRIPKGFFMNNNVCFINFSYANKFRAFIFLMVSIFNINNRKKLKRKLE